MDNNLINVVFIDDGISGDNIPNNVVFESYFANDIGVYIDSSLINATHGTTCYEIFHNLVNQPYKLISIKVIDNITGKGSKKALLNALSWCVDKNIHLINMSLGTHQYSSFDSINECVNKLYNTIIVAACNNSNTLTIPACLPNVIGVRHSKQYKIGGGYYYVNNPIDYIDVLVHSKKNNNENVSNSCVAPVISAYVFNYITESITSIADIRQKLNADALINNFSPNYCYYKNLFSTWEKIKIPVVSIIGDGSESFQTLINLVKLMIKKGYRAVVLSQFFKTKIELLLFSLNNNNIYTDSLSSLIELYYNVTLPDIIFLHLDKTTLQSLPNELKSDLKVNLNVDVLETYKIIKHHFN